MSDTKPLKAELLRYSQKPIYEYVRKVKTTLIGPAASKRLDNIYAWNLAFLSFDFDKTLQPADPYFSTHVRRTLQFQFDGSGVDLTISDPYENCIGQWLCLPAPRVVYLIRRLPNLNELPLYAAYGNEWLETIEARSRICVSDTSDDIEALTDFSLARQALLPFLS